MSARRIAFHAAVMTLALGCSAPYGTADDAPPQAAVPPTPPLPPGQPPPGAPGPGACDPQGPYRFCDDFDQERSLDDGRWKTNIGGSGNLALDRQSLSPPVAAHTSISPGAMSSAVLVKELPLRAAKARAELDMRLDAEVDRVDAPTSLVGVGLPRGEHAGLAIVNGKVIVQIGDAMSVVRQIGVASFPVATWTHVVLEVVFDAQQGRVFLSADERVLLDVRGLVMRSSDTDVSVFRVGLGVTGAAEVPVSLRLDNVKVF